MSSGNKINVTVAYEQSTFLYNGSPKCQLVVQEDTSIRFKLDTKTAANYRFAGVIFDNPNDPDIGKVSIKNQATELKIKDTYCQHDDDISFRIVLTPLKSHECIVSPDPQVINKPPQK
ncbi:DP-EP family protein [Shewanella subflava]|uniref:DP-EP family protein n=1 Tax=Shewanella subflava TaxID=2986476 RepID=A0ABT3I6F4_9GAMM|nr:DP-EP family protein [Shewanella subflava]MCW3171564.1 DP-EP family protein [Shewanella subflava]